MACRCFLGILLVSAFELPVQKEWPSSLTVDQLFRFAAESSQKALLQFWKNGKNSHVFYGKMVKNLVKIAGKLVFGETIIVVQISKFYIKMFYIGAHDGCEIF